MREPETSAHQRLRTRAALRDNTLVTAQELELVLPEGLASWVVDQVEPCSVVEGITLYEWGDVRGMLANPPRPKVVEANKRRRAHKKEAPAKRGHLTIAEAAAELGISDRTLRKRLKDGVPRIKGGACRHQLRAVSALALPAGHPARVVEGPQRARRTSGQAEEAVASQAALGAQDQAQSRLGSGRQRGLRVGSPGIIVPGYPGFLGMIESGFRDGRVAGVLARSSRPCPRSVGLPESFMEVSAGSQICLRITPSTDFETIERQLSREHGPQI